MTVTIGLDVHASSVRLAAVWVACVRLPGGKGRREERVAGFSTTTQGLLALHDWLEAQGVTQVVGHVVTLEKAPA